MKRKYKAVFIDWNGTLSTSKFFGHLEKENPKLFENIQNTLFGEELRHLLGPWMIGEFDSETVIKHLANKLNYSHVTLLNEFIKSCKNMAVADEVISLIKQIRQAGTKVVIATDNMDSFDKWTTPALNLNAHFDAILNSYSLKARKKQFDSGGKSLFFENYLLQEGFRPRETILIDDSEDEENRLADYGIVYRKIKFGGGLKTELKKIIFHKSSH